MNVSGISVTGMKYYHEQIKKKKKKVALPANIHPGIHQKG